MPHAYRPKTARVPAAKPGPPPTHYALTVPGLENIAAAELRAAGATITSILTRIDKRDGMVLFRATDIAPILGCGTIEDLFQVVLDAPTGGGRNAPRRLARAMERTDFERGRTAHHALRPGKRGRSYRVVARVSGEQPFRRDEVETAFTSAVDGMLSKWVPARENPALELWVHVIGDRTIAGVRLSDDSLAGRAYKRAHLPASLKPTVARALAVMAEVGPSRCRSRPDVRCGDDPARGRRAGDGGDEAHARRAGRRRRHRC